MAAVELPRRGGDGGGADSPRDDSGAGGNATASPRAPPAREITRVLRPIDVIGYVDIAEMVYQPTAEELKAQRALEREAEAAKRRAPPKIPVKLSARPLLVGREHMRSPAFSPRLWDGLLDADGRPPEGSDSLGAFVSDRRQAVHLVALRRQ